MIDDRQKFGSATVMWMPATQRKQKTNCTANGRGEMCFPSVFVSMLAHFNQSTDLSSYKS